MNCYFANVAGQATVMRMLLMAVESFFQVNTQLKYTSCLGSIWQLYTRYTILDVSFVHGAPSSIANEFLRCAGNIECAVVVHCSIYHICHSRYITAGRISHRGLLQQAFELPCL